MNTIIVQLVAYFTYSEAYDLNVVCFVKPKKLFKLFCGRPEVEGGEIYNGRNLLYLLSKENHTRKYS